MRTKYSIQEAHSGTSDKEIAKAKRIYRKKVKTGEIPDFENVTLCFSDVNYVISVTYIIEGVGGVGWAALT